jgi:hypothetical protein
LAKGGISMVPVMIAVSFVFVCVFVIRATLQNANSTSANRASVTSATSTKLLRVGLDDTHITGTCVAPWLINTWLFVRMNLDGRRFAHFSQVGTWMANTRDWFDSPVQHPRNYSRSASVCGDRLTFINVLAKLDGYMYCVKVLEPSPLHDTVAIVAFMPYNCEHHLGCSGQELTRRALTANLKSLRLAGIGRLAVVPGVPTNEYDPRGVSYGDTTLVFGSVDAAITLWCHCWRSAMWCHCGAVAGVQRATRGEDVKRQACDMGRLWFVFLAEPDHMFRVRPRWIRDLCRAVESDFVHSPHRLQPVLRPGRVRALPQPVPGNSSGLEVETAVNDCAKRLGASRKREGRAEHVANWWWQCPITICFIIIPATTLGNHYHCFHGWLSF